MIRGKNSKLRIAVVSDIHLGHRRNPTNEIIANLYKAFPDNAETAELDIIFLAGDVFDDLLTMSDDDVWEIKHWVSSFLRLCKKHDIKVRVLEGTPSHDWRQSRLFPTVNTVAALGVDLKYITDLSIEYIEENGITVLYVPDEWDTADNTLSQVHELLRAKGLDKVDYAIMHGQFEYQLPPFIKAQKHSSEEYLKLVRELVFIGHVHNHSRNDRIIAQGSFDRLSHGEEAPKGHVRAVIHRPGEHEVRFIETVDAKRFVTVNCVDHSLEETLDAVDRRCSGLPDGSHVRVEANHDNPIFTNMELLIRKYPLYIWTKLPREKQEEEEIRIVEEESVFVPITITRDNIAALLTERLATSGANAEVLECANAILAETI